MFYRSKDGYLLIDAIMSLIVVSLVITTLFKYHAITSKIVRSSHIDHQLLHSVTQVMDSALQAEAPPFLPPIKKLSINYISLPLTTIQEKPYDYSFNFEKDFVFIVVTTTRETKKSMLVVSGKGKV